MIIRLTVHNIKYTAKLKAFANVLNECDEYYGSNTLPEPNQSIAMDQLHYSRLKKLIIENNATEDQIIDYIRIIKSKFKHFCTDYLFEVIPENERTYMLKNFDVSIIRSLSQKDENNEVVYVFPKTFGIYAQTIIL